MNSRPILPRAVDAIGALTLVVGTGILICMLNFSISSMVEFTRSNPARTYAIIIGTVALSLGFAIPFIVLCVHGLQRGGTGRVSHIVGLLLCATGFHFAILAALYWFAWYRWRLSSWATASDAQRLANKTVEATVDPARP